MDGVKRSLTARGICRVCLCTEEDGCEGGCAWTDRGRTLCSACRDLSLLEELEIRRAAVDRLQTMRRLLRKEYAEVQRAIADVQRRLRFAHLEKIPNRKPPIQIEN